MTKPQTHQAITTLSVLTLTLAGGGVAVASGVGSHVNTGADHAPAHSAEFAPATSEDGPSWVPIQTVRGVGHFRLHEPSVSGDEITFRVNGRTARTGLSTGRFSFRHHAPARSGQQAWTARGVGRIVCLKVHDDHALLTAVITREHTPAGELGPHAFYLKITGGSPDRVTFFQGPPPTLTEEPYRTPGCEEPDTFLPPGVEPNEALLDSGDWQLQSRASSSPAASSM